MKIFGYNVDKTGIYNPTKRAAAIQSAANTLKKKSKRVTERIRKMALGRIRIAITNWKNARISAESEIMPNNTELIRVFKDIEIDAHLWAIMQTIRLKVMANKFSLYTSGDEIDDEATEKFRKKWFRTIVKEVVDSDFYGFSLVQLGDVLNGCFESSELVPREYVVQQRRGVKMNLGDSTTLISFDEPKYKNWLVPIGDERNLGLLDKAAPLVIKKKEVISAWSEAAELFGMPIRIGKTNINNPENRENMEDMLENMGEAAWAVFDTDDEIELKDTSKTDISNMFDKFIERVNSELSKLILLQTGTTDEKSFVGSANVHENILKDVIEAYVIRVEDLVNEVLIPICERHGIVKSGTYIKADNEQKFTPKELFDIVKELLKEFDIPADWISETFEVPVEEKEIPEPLDPNAEVEEEEELDDDDPNNIIDPKASATSVMKSVAKLYDGILETCKH